MLAAACALVVGALGCSEDVKPRGCPARAAFHVSVRAVDGPLPRETTIDVEHGGGSEKYSIDAAGIKNEILVCEEVHAAEPDASDAGSSESEVVEISCDLWTQGATDVRVTAPGYPEIEKQLAVETDDGCITTLSVELTLDPCDGAPPI